MNSTDQLLVESCRAGDREAFAMIVERYQTLVCSIAYSATGNLNASEELAQETFVAAWRSIDQLREPDQLRAWLTGITRNLSRNALRRQKRDLLHAAGAFDERDAKLVSEESDPVEATISSEEAALMQRTLDTIPETYREPLVLYYREQQSMERVAELLDLSQDAVKQRLSRGRRLLRNEIAAVIEQGLRLSKPGRAFTLGVLAALPVLSGTAKAATVTVTGAKGVSAMQAAGWAGMTGAILGPLAGILGAWFGVSMSLKSARSEQERAFIIKSTWAIGALVVVFVSGLTTLLILGQGFIRANPVGFVIAVVVLAFGYVLALLGMIFWGNARVAQIRKETGTLDTPSAGTKEMPKFLHRWQEPAEFDSPTRLLGLPLVSIRFNGDTGETLSRRPAVGWIAIGDKAYGVLFASGSVAVGGIAFGAIGIGVFAFAGTAFGLLPLGGMAIGAMAIGGIAAGTYAFGGCALGWQGAMGGVAVANDMAIGGLAVAENANNDVAKEFFASHWFFSIADLFGTHSWLWLVLVVVCLLPIWWAKNKVDRVMAKAANARHDAGHDA